MLPTGFLGFCRRVFPSLPFPGTPRALLWPGAHRKLLPRRHLRHRLRDLQVQAGVSGRALQKGGRA